MKKIIKNKSTDWEDVSKWYVKYLQDDTDSYHAKVIIPNMVRILGNVKNKKILDLGCGNGIFGHILAHENASVIGVDGSPTLIAIANKNALVNEKYYVQDVRKGLPRGLEGFDHCVSILSIQNMDSIHTVFSSIKSVLKDTGSFHIVTLHPAFRIPKLSDWSFDEKRKE